MRLLNTGTLRMEEFLDETLIEYVILSHTWSEEEVLHENILSPESSRAKSGFAKLEGFCKTAAAAGYTYCWIDTCCIDKSSTTELSEAINSMFRWYRKASICYVYLADFRVDMPNSRFKESNWFTRGWTLQELLAPILVEFYDADWVRVGGKEDLVEVIHAATGIDETAIKQFDSHRFCVAEKMSWAANRVTTRPEDVAYSLLGLFDVNMPMLYGEGKTKAYLRLQEHIIQNSNDRSIFAWQGTDRLYTGALARTPSFFEPSKSFFSQLVHATRWYSRSTRIMSSYSLTNCGLEIELCLWPIAYKTYQASITGFNDAKIPSHDVCFFLRWLPMTNQYVRTQFLDQQVINGKDSNATDLVSLSARQRRISRPYMTSRVMILDRLGHSDYPRLYDLFNRSPQTTPNIRLDTVALGKNPSLKLVHIHTAGDWSAKRNLLKLDSDFFGTAVIFTFDQPGTLGSLRTDPPRKLLIGYDFYFFPVCVIMTSPGCGSSRKISTTSYQPKFSDDVSKKCIEDITCLETKGWSRVSEHAVDEVEGRKGTWAIKCNSYETVCKTFGGSNNWFIKIALELADTWEWHVTIGENNNGRPSRTWRPQYVPDHLRARKMARALKKAPIDKDSGDEKEDSDGEVDGFADSRHLADTNSKSAAH